MHGSSLKLAVSAQGRSRVLSHAVGSCRDPAGAVQAQTTYKPETLVAISLRRYFSRVCHFCHSRTQRQMRDARVRHT